jgi:hydrogenase maturation protease
MKVLVAGIGNIFLGDDGFGVEVANRLLHTPAPEGVRIEDFGIRGVHLAYELLDGYDTLVLVDALPMDEPPGTVAIVEPDVASLVAASEASGTTVDAHSMNPAVVLGMLTGMGGSVGRVVIVGCEPASIEETIGLSAPVEAAVDRGVQAVHDLLDELVPQDQVGEAQTASASVRVPHDGGPEGEEDLR